MDDHRHAIKGDHLLGIGTFQIAKRFQVDQFAVFDRARGRRQVGVTVFKRGKTGARPVGRNVHLDQLALSSVALYLDFVGNRAGQDLDVLHGLRLQHAAHQGWRQHAADSVGTLQA